LLQSSKISLQVIEFNKAFSSQVQHLVQQIEINLHFGKDLETDNEKKSSKKIVLTKKCKDFIGNHVIEGFPKVKETLSGRSYKRILIAVISKYWKSDWENEMKGNSFVVNLSKERDFQKKSKK